MEKIKEIRIKIFTLIRLVYLLPSSREILLCRTNLKRSRMFLGKVLGELLPGNNPYPESKNPESDKIELEPHVLPYKDIIANLKELRLRIDEVEKELADHDRIFEINFADFWGLEFYRIAVT